MFSRIELLVKSIVTFGVVTVFFSGCSADVGPSIETPEVPAPSVARVERRARLAAQITLGHFTDRREPIEALGSGDITQPQGKVARKVEAALVKSFVSNGISIVNEAPYSIQGEVRKWNASVMTTASSKLRSEAALYIEVLNESGVRVYSGTYHGSRASQFPIASAGDIQDSLGLAMSQAIGQILEDEGFLQALMPQ